jgi:asparagine synthase (glutamine-hydrolysing)
MCGILTLLNYQGDPEEFRKIILRQVKKLRHRGPDWSGIYADEFAILAHERLAIVDIEHGAQPLFSRDQNIVLAVNGEIYNHRELPQLLKTPYEPLTQSDCEPIIPLYNEMGPKCVEHLSGIFALVLYDKKTKNYLIARDHLGIVPLYWGWDSKGNLFVASEAKALEGVCETIEEFPPGHYYFSGDKTSEAANKSTGAGEHHDQKLVRYYKPAWTEVGRYPTKSVSIPDLRNALIESVKRQLMSDVPYGVLLSGGLDSSIVAAVAKTFQDKRIETDSKDPAWWPQLHSFAIGLDGSPDLAAAKKVADHIGTIHHTMHFTVQEGLDALRDVIYHLETFDVTTVRASTPMYLLARKIKTMGIKMVLSGEGADEIFGGYLYFHKAPNKEEFHDENVRKLLALSKYDCLRANKSMASWGVEARVPFLDKEFLEVAMNVNPQDKMIVAGQKMEKYILRQAFADMLPPEIAWRQKEQFSDGVGYNWIDSLQAHAKREVSDEKLAKAKQRFPINPPHTKEAYFYREIFEEHFKNPSLAKCVPEGPTVACSSATAFLWDEAFKKMADPSGRAVAGVHLDSKK